MGKGTGLGFCEESDVKSGRVLLFQESADGAERRSE